MDKTALGNLAEGSLFLCNDGIFKVRYFFVLNSVREEAQCEQVYRRVNGTWQAVSSPETRIKTNTQIVVVPSNITLNNLNERKEKGKKWSYRPVKLSAFVEHIQGKKVVEEDVSMEIDDHYSANCALLCDGTIIAVLANIYEYSVYDIQFRIGEECPIMVDGLGISIAEGD